MIEIRNLHKYFNKNRSNQIHVINNTSIQFPEKGLVAITGPSGCGKTTLLNVIAGLDNFHSGEIIYEGESVKKYKSSKVDYIRNEKIGFIFQNYHLLPDQSVYDNIKTSLNIAGLYDKEELDKRINYSLDKVGMYNYRKRNVLALSGGQQQRVGIARAIAKNPDVIFADEPTGNLDSNNTFEVMSLIKNISRNKLVILVTHERHLVDLFADRIIELKDGIVTNDYQNFKNTSYQHKDDRFIYLKDLNKEDLETKFIDYYYEKENNKHFDFKVVEMNDTIYIQTNSDKKIQFIDHESEISLVDDHKKEFKTEEMEALDFDKFKAIEHHHHKSLFRWRDTLFTGLKKLFTRRKIGRKILVFAYFVISAVVAFQLASLGNIIRINEYEFLSAPKSYVSIEKSNKLSTSDYEEIMEIEGIGSPILYSDQYYSQYVNFYQQSFYQTSLNVNLSVWPIKASWVDSDDLLVGKLPSNINEVAISSFTADMILSNYRVTQMGYEDVEDLLDFSVLGNVYGGGNRLAFKVVGVIDASETLIVYPDKYYGLSHDSASFVSIVEAYEDSINISEGRMPATDTEILAYKSAYYSINQQVTLGSGLYKIVGLYELDNDSNLNSATFLLTEKAAELVAVQNSNIYREGGYKFHADDKEAVLKALEDLGYEAYDIYEHDREIYLEDRNFNISASVSSMIAIFIGIILFIYFLMRTSMINRVKEIGIYRAIGATKKDVYKIFVSEILVYTSLLSATGYLIAAYVLTTIENSIGSYYPVFYLPFWLLMLGLAGIYLVNLVFGLLPIYNLMRKSPAEILAKYDI